MPWWPASRTRSLTAINVLRTVAASCPRKRTRFSGRTPPTSCSVEATRAASISAYLSGRSGGWPWSLPTTTAKRSTCAAAAPGKRGAGARSALDEAPPCHLAAVGNCGTTALELQAQRLELDRGGAEQPQDLLVSNRRVQAGPERQRHVVAGVDALGAAARGEVNGSVPVRVPAENGDE